MKPFKKFLKVLHWKRSPKPHITLNEQFYEQFKPFRIPVILLIMLMMLGTFGYMIIDHFSLMDAIYQTGITFTTVGFGEVAPISQIGRVFTISLIILGFAVFSISLGIIAEVINKGELIAIVKERRMLYKIARLKNHFVLFYHNEYTIHIANELRQSHMPFVVVDTIDNLENVAAEHRYPYYVKADPHTQTTLLKCFLSSAKGAVTLSKNIADNIAQIASIRLYEKEIGRDKYRPFYLLTSAETVSDIDKLKKLGADNVVSPPKLMAQRIGAMAVRPDMENLLEQFMYKRDTPLDMEEILVPRRSWMTLARIKETHLRAIASVSIIGLWQKDGKFIPMPQGDTIITSNSRLLVIGQSKDISLTKRVVRMTQKPEELRYV